MIRKISLLVPVVVLLPWTVSAQDAKAVVANAAKAMGIQDLSKVGSVMYSGAGATFDFGQAKAPDAPWPRSEVSSYRRVVDFDAGGSLEVITRAVPGEAKEKTEIERIPFVEPYGQQGKQYEIWITPLAFLKGALKNNAVVKPAVIAGKSYTSLSYIYDNNPAKYQVTGYINDQNQVERVEARVDNPLLGDVLVQASYSDYKDFHRGVVFPSKITETEAGHPVLDLTVTAAVRDIVADPDLPVIEAESVQYNSDANPKYRDEFFGAPPPITVDEILFGDHVYYFGFHVEDIDNDERENYHSVVVEFNDYLAVIEAPLDAAHANAAIKEIHTLFGPKPIRYVINTHAHLDASGGLRAYAAEGATIITQDLNKPYLEKAMNAPHTLNPDKLARTKRKVQIEGVASKRVITDGTESIELYKVANDSSDGMLIAYLPKEKVVVEADLYTVPFLETTIDKYGKATPPAKPPVTPYAAAFARTLDSLKLDYQKILGLRGRAATKQELLDDTKTLEGQGQAAR